MAYSKLSPFPGMDMFLEMQVWRDFHTNLIIAMQKHLNGLLLPRYVARVEERVYMEHSDLYAARSIYPDVSIIRESSEQRAESAGSGPKVLEPVTLTAPIPEEHRENYLTLVDLTTRDLITVIELLSPSNKRASGDGRREYLKKERHCCRAAFI